MTVVEYKEEQIDSRVCIVETRNELELTRIEIFKELKLDFLNLVELSEILLSEAIKLILENRLGFILINKNYTKIPISMVSYTNYLADILYLKVYSVIGDFNVNKPIYIDTYVNNYALHIIVKWRIQ